MRNNWFAFPGIFIHLALVPMKRLIFFLALISSLIISGCQPEVEIPALETLNLVRIGLPINYRDHYSPLLLNCMNTLPGISLQINTYSDTFPDPEEYQLIIWQGTPAQHPDINLDNFTLVKLDSDELVVIGSIQNQLSSISITDLRSIFAGNIQDWSGLPGSGISGQIDLWNYYDAHPLRIVFEDAIGSSLPVTTSARIIPSQVEAVLKVEENPASLSYIGKSYLNQNVRIIPITGISEPPNLPVFAINHKDKEKIISPLVDCLLNSNNQ